MALQVALRGTHEIGAEVTLIDLRGYQLIFCDGKENESGYPNDVFRLRDEVKSALKFGVCRDTVRRNLPQLHKCRLFGFS